jgi:hypothetical protein
MKKARWLWIVFISITVSAAFGAAMGWFWPIHNHTVLLLGHVVGGIFISLLFVRGSMLIGRTALVSGDGNMHVQVTVGVSILAYILTVFVFLQTYDRFWSVALFAAGHVGILVITCVVPWCGFLSDTALVLLGSAVEFQPGLVPLKLGLALVSISSVLIVTRFARFEVRVFAFSFQAPELRVLLFFLGLGLLGFNPACFVRDRPNNLAAFGIPLGYLAALALEVSQMGLRKVAGYPSCVGAAGCRGASCDAP